MDVLYNVKPALESGVAHTSTEVIPNTEDLLPGSFREAELAKSALSSHTLEGEFLQLLSILRGGNHPFLERYKAHLRPLQPLEMVPAQ